MLDLSRERFSVGLVRDESQLGHGVAGPAGRLTLAVTLQKEACNKNFSFKFPSMANPARFRYELRHASHN